MCTEEHDSTAPGAESGTFGREHCRDCREGRDGGPLARHPHSTIDLLCGVQTAASAQPAHYLNQAPNTNCKDHHPGFPITSLTVTATDCKNQYCAKTCVRNTHIVNVAGQEVPKVQTDLRCCSVQSVYSSVQHGNAHPGQLPVKYSPLTIIMPFLNICNSFPGLENGPRQYQGPSGPLTPKQVRQHSGCSAP